MLTWPGTIGFFRQIKELGRGGGVTLAGEQSHAGNFVQSIFHSQLGQWLYSGWSGRSSGSER